MEYYYHQALLLVESLSPLAKEADWMWNDELVENSPLHDIIATVM